MDVCIRYYEGKDYKPLIELLRKVYKSEIDKDTLEKQYINKTRNILVAILEGKQLIGCTFIEIQEDYVRPSRKLYVTYVAVDEQYREKGVGKKLMEVVENECVQRKCTSIEFTSASFRIKAHAFYESLGYTQKKTVIFIKEMVL